MRRSRCPFAFWGVVLAFLTGCTLDFDECLIEGRCGRGGGEGGAGGSGGAAVGAPSCAGLPATCGGDQSCCATAEIPGGNASRGTDASGDGTHDGNPIRGWIGGAGAPVTLSSFRSDRFEVTVGRFRTFVRDYDAWRAQGKPTVGDGAHPARPETGWDGTWPLPADETALEAELGCQGGTWTPQPGSEERRPINCVSWYVAMAFCIWDGARLPSEAEWHYMASGGDELRAFPWSSPPDDLTSTASYAVIGDQPLEAVGMRSLGAGRWGVMGLGGSVREWVLDVAEDINSYQEPCVDCVAWSDFAFRVRRGGDFEAPMSRARTTHRSDGEASQLDRHHGIRCVR